MWWQALSALSLPHLQPRPFPAEVTQSLLPVNWWHPALSRSGASHVPSPEPKTLPQSASAHIPPSSDLNLKVTPWERASHLPKFFPVTISLCTCIFHIYCSSRLIMIYLFVQVFNVCFSFRVKLPASEPMSAVLIVVPLAPRKCRRQLRRWAEGHIAYLLRCFRVYSNPNKQVVQVGLSHWRSHQWWLSHQWLSHYWLRPSRTSDSLFQIQGGFWSTV